MQDWLRQRNTARKARALTFWTPSTVPGARFRARLRALARGSVALLVVAAGVATPVPDARASDTPTTGSLMMRTESGEQPLPHLDATFDITGIAEELKPMQTAMLVAHGSDGTTVEVLLNVRLDTPAEVDYYNAGGILPYVLEQIIAG